MGGSSPKMSREDVYAILPLEITEYAREDITGKGLDVSKQLVTDEDNGEECDIITVVREAAS